MPSLRDVPTPPVTARRLHGPFVKALREALGIRAADLAREVGLSRGYLSHVEQGTKQPSTAVVGELARALGVTVRAITYPVRHPVCTCTVALPLPGTPGTPGGVGTTSTPSPENEVPAA